MMPVMKNKKIKLKEDLNMRSFKKKVMAGVLSAAVAVSVLGTITPASAAALSAKQYLAKMEKVTNAAKSCELKQTVTQEFSQAGQNISSTTVTKQIVFQKPIKTKTASSTKMTGEGIDQSSTTIAYIQEDENGTIYEYVSVDGSDYEAVDVTDVFTRASELDASLYSDAKIVKTSANIVKISAIITGSDMAKSMDALLGAGSDGSDDGELAIDYSSLNAVDVTIWIDKKTYQPVKVATDMAAFYDSYFKAIYAAMGAECDISYTTAKSTGVYSNFNNARNVPFPEF